MNKGILYFYAEWCPQCPAMSNNLENINNQIQILKFNTDYDQSAVEKYNITSVPTLVLIENGNEIKRSVGSKTTSQIIEWLNS